MHEMALVRNIVDIVVEQAEVAGVSEVKRIHIVVGEGRDIVEHLFEGLFQFLARGTVAEHAEIVLDRIPYTVQCNQCGFTFHLDVFDRQSWGCPSCQAYQDYTLISGMEFFISDIEVASSESCVHDPVTR